MHAYSFYTTDRQLLKGNEPVALGVVQASSNTLNSTTASTSYTDAVALTAKVTAASIPDRTMEELDALVDDIMKQHAWLFNELANY
jgi:hypothetical protein